MAVESVHAIVNETSYPLVWNSSTGKYEAALIAPVRSGEEDKEQIYQVSVKAVSDSGNVTILDSSDPVLGSQMLLKVRNLSDATVFVIKGSRWRINDRFNAVDYNRIKNNLYVLKNLVNEVYCPLEIEDMGDDKNFTSWFYAKEFNLFEKNLETINRTVFGENIGETKTFFPNGPFIDYVELNRIEDTALAFFVEATEQKKLLPRLAFRLGGAKGVKI